MIMGSLGTITPVRQIGSFLVLRHFSRVNSDAFLPYLGYMYKARHPRLLYNITALGACALRDSVHVVG